MSSEEQLSEYQSQLSDIELLLADSPEDESLLKLKSDLIELISLTKEQLVSCQNGEVEAEYSNNGGSAGNDDDDNDNADDNGNDTNTLNKATNTTDHRSWQAATDLHDANHIAAASSSSTTAAAAVATATKTKASLKKSKKILSKEFEIPTHLIPLDSDTDAERKRKKRTVKALKAQYKATQKKVESEVKQHSWQEFNKKQKRKGGAGGDGESIFKTEDGIGARTGVITGSVQVLGQERSSAAGKVVNVSSKKQRHLF